MDPKRALILALLVSGCATVRNDISARDDIPERAGIQAPFFAQGDQLCGPATAAMALAWTGAEVTPENLAPQVFNAARRGTLTSDMMALFRRHGRLAVLVDDVLGELSAGHPVVVFQNLGLDEWPVWHYALATGYDLDAGTVTLHSGTVQGLEVSLAAFQATWERGGRWALAVLPPDRLPATADERAVAEAAIGLERAGQARAAAMSYAAMLERWPDSPVAALGLGNALYQAGDREGAVQAFTQATIRHPDFEAARNNLAHVLGELDSGLAPP